MGQTSVSVSNKNPTKRNHRMISCSHQIDDHIDFPAADGLRRRTHILPLVGYVAFWMIGTIQQGKRRQVTRMLSPHRILQRGGKFALKPRPPLPFLLRAIADVCQMRGLSINLGRRPCRKACFQTLPGRIYPSCHSQSDWKSSPTSYLDYHLP